MIYKDLLNKLNQMSPEDLEKPVTVLLIDAGEFAGVWGDLVYSDESDTLEVGTPYLMID
jgi:hypothetical protein